MPRYDPLGIPETWGDFLFTSTVNWVASEAAMATFTWITRIGEIHHYRDMGITDKRQMRLQSYRGPSRVQKWGRTMGLIAMNPRTPTVAGWGAGVSALAIGTRATMKPGVDIEHGPYGVVRIVPKLGWFV